MFRILCNLVFWGGLVFGVGFVGCQAVGLHGVVNFDIPPVAVPVLPAVPPAH